MNTAPSESWRTWLITGNRGAPADRRRVRGSHRGLKKILIEGMTSEAEASRPWKDFSAAMVRQSVNEAIYKLPVDHMAVVMLAYFGGLSNREIAHELDLTVAGVQRRLRQAVDNISRHIERGGAIGRHALYAALGWFAGSQLVRALHRGSSIGAEHLASALVVATVSTVMAVQPAAVQPAGQAMPRPQIAVSSPPAAASRPAAEPQALISQASPTGALPVAVDLPAPVVPKLPALPKPPVPVPKAPKLPGLS